MIRLAPLITADVDNATLPGGKASDAAQDFLALLSEALAGETTTDKAAPQLLVATDKPTTKGEPLVSEILADAQQADLLIPVDETPPVINDEQSTSTPLTTAQTMTLAAVADNNTAKDEKADDLNEDRVLLSTPAVTPKPWRKISANCQVTASNGYSFLICSRTPRTMK